MINEDVAQILSEIAMYLDMQNVAFKPRAYEKAAEAIAGLEENIGETYTKGGLKALELIPGVGVSIAEKIEEYITTHNIRFYEELKKKIPVRLGELSRIEGLGPKSIKRLYQELKITNLKDLETAAKKGKIRTLAGFGAKSEEKILRGIGFASMAGERLSLLRVLPQARAIESELSKMKGVQKVTVAGSVRRGKETIGDVDVLVVAKNSKPIMKVFTGMANVATVLAEGETKASIKLDSGLQVDLRVVPEESYGAALHYFTGSKEHNVALRTLALKKGMTLNEYGLHRFAKGKKGKLVAGKTEEEVYRALGMDYIEPEMRENTGEIERALAHSLPNIIELRDLRGDLQVQTNWTDGSGSIEDMARSAIARGFSYIAITDHTKHLVVTHGLDEKRIVKQWAEIDRINKKLVGKIVILKGTECDILKDGSLDLPDNILSKLDVVGVSVHSYFNLPEKEQTERILRAMHNPHADILFHPTGRIVGKREPYAVDMEQIIKTARETGTVLEIDGNERLDLKDEYIRKCVESGVKLAIDSDAHATNQYVFLDYGIIQAKRGWAEKKDIINAWSLEKMLKNLKH